MNYLHQFKNENDFEKHLKSKLLESLKLMQKELDIPSDTNHFYIDKSTIPNSGNGLFTNKSFKIGDVVCYYPPVIIYDNDEHNLIHNYDNFDPNKFEHYITGDYIMNIHGFRLIALKDSHIKNNMYLGHLINDNNYNSHKIYTDNKHNCYCSLNSYELTTDSFKDNKAIVIKAVKNIKPGDELFLHYGKKYWYSADNENISRHLKIKKSLSK